MWIVFTLIATAASVCTLALVEVLFARAISVFGCRQRTMPRSAGHRTDRCRGGLAGGSLVDETICQFCSAGGNGNSWIEGAIWGNVTGSIPNIVFDPLPISARTKLGPSTLLYTSAVV